MITGNPNKQTGFTLVEIAIVLVIIGLLLGGILKGQEMITQARIKNVVNDFNGVTAAYFAYQDRYKAIPGDDQGANARWTSVSPTAGTGNGSVAGGYSDAPGATAPTNANETLLFWWHLRLAGFVPGPTQGQGSWTQPNNAVGGIVGVQDSPIGLTGLGICSANITDKIAGAIDTQLDDQKPGTGSVRSATQSASNQATSGVTVPSASTSYVEGGSVQYLVCRGI